MYYFFIDYTKALDCVGQNKLWNILKEMGIPATLPVSWETYMQVKKQQLELDMEKKKKNWTWNNGLVPNWERGVSCCILSPCLFNLTYMQCISNEMPDWMKHKL